MAFAKSFEITVPKNMPEGRSLLRISDVDSSQAWEKSRAPMKAAITDMQHLIRFIREEKSNNELIVELFAPKAGVTIGDKELPALPLTAFSVMSSPKYTDRNGPTRGTTFMRQKISTDYVISGSATLPMDIDWNAQ